MSNISRGETAVKRNDRDDMGFLLRDEPLSCDVVGRFQPFAQNSACVPKEAAGVRSSIAWNQEAAGTHLKI